MPGLNTNTIYFWQILGDGETHTVFGFFYYLLAHFYSLVVLLLLFSFFFFLIIFCEHFLETWF